MALVEFLFLRGTDGHLPPRPNQAMHCHGLPIPGGPIYESTALHDLKAAGNGTQVDFFSQEF